MPGQDLDAGGSPAGRDLPQPNGARDVATGEEPPIRAPGQRGDRARMRHVLQGRAQRSLPQPDSRVMSPTGKNVSIRSKDQTVDAAGLTACPQLVPTLTITNIPYASPTPTAIRSIIPTYLVTTL